MRDAASVTGSLLIAVACARFDPQLAFPGYWALVPTAGAACVIAAGPRAWVNRTLLSGRALVGIGLVSYPLYLWHWPALSFLQTTSAVEPSIALRGAAVTASGLVAWGTFRFVERPIQSGFFGSRTVAVLGLAMSMIAGLGLVVYERDGFTARPANRGLGLGLEYPWRSLYRFGSCFIDSDDAAAAFAPTCDGASRESKPDEPLVLLWGDSHAAALYPGLNAASHEHPFRIAQFTSTACAPVVGMARRDRCVALAAEVIEKVRTLHPDRVILAGYWARYDGKGGWDVMDDDALVRTIALVKQERVADVVVVGDLPVFSVDQPIVGLQEFIPHARDRTYTAFEWRVAASDARVKAAVARTSATFVSAIDRLCNADGCLMSTERGKLSPLAWDYGHLTREGSIYLERAGHLAPR